MANLTLKRLAFYLPTRSLKLTQETTLVLQKRFISTDSESLKTVSPSKSSRGFPIQDVQFEEIKSQKQESDLDFLRSLDFSDTHIKKLLNKCPRVLQSRANGTLKPKLQYLRDNGFVGPLLPELIVANTYLLRRSLSGKIKPAIEFLKKYLETDEKVVAAIKRSGWLLTFDLKGIMQPNIEFLLSEGVPKSNLAKFIMTQPRSIMQNVDRIVHAVETVKELGLEPTVPLFIHCVRVLLAMSESTWKKKVQNFKSLGWSDEEITSAFKRDPIVLGCSEEKIRSALDFYVNTVKLDRGVIAGYPKLLTYGVNTRIRPRYSVIKILESRKLLKKDKKLVWIFTLNERDFLKKCVDKHLDQVPNLMELYHGAISGDKVDSQVQ